MNVRELREALAFFPDDAIVVIAIGGTEEEDVTVGQDDADGVVYCVIEG